MSIDSKVPISRSDVAFLYLGMAAIGIPMILQGAFAILVTAFDRHPGAPFVEPDRVAALELLSSACGIPGPTFTVLPASFEVQEARIKQACEVKLKRSSEL